MLLLTKEEIESLASPKELIQVIGQAARLYEEGGFVMPDRIGVTERDNTYLYMPCFAPEAHGTKILTLFPGNAARGLPRIQGVMLLNDPQTGALQGILDGAALTACRTGAVGALGICCTAPQDASRLALIGAGVQGLHQCLFAAEVRPIREVYVYDPIPASAQRLAETLGARADLSVTLCASAREAVEQGEIVVTATASNDPVIPDDRQLVRGKHFIGIGSYKPFMREYPRAVFQEAEQILIDVEFAKEETGDLATPLREGWIQPQQVATVGKVLDKPCLTAGTTLYKSVGMALFDLMTANFLAAKAAREGVGRQVDW